MRVLVPEVPSRSPLALRLRPFRDKPRFFPARSACRDNARVEGWTGAKEDFQQSGSPAVYTPTQCDAALTPFLSQPKMFSPFTVCTAVRPPALMRDQSTMIGRLCLHANKRASVVPCMKIIRLQ